MHASTTTRPALRAPLSIAIAAALAILPATHAFAQDPADDEPAPAQDEAQPAQQDPVDLQTVYVTANKRQENIREVAISITRLDEQQLESMNATQMSDYASYVPGLQLQSNGTPGQTQVSMRGIAALSPGSTVGTYVDEAPVGSNSLYQQATLFQLDLLPYDIESIEVLRGPQGTLYGAGAMGGLVKYAMRKPDVHQTEFRVGAGVAMPRSGDVGVNYRVGANLPVVEGSMALRASYASNALPGYVDNLVDGREDINEGSQTSARVALRWEGAASSVQFAAMRQEVDSENNAAIALDPDTMDPVDGLSNFIHVDESFRKRVDHYSLAADWDAGFADFVSASSYAETHTAIRGDLSLSYGEYPLAFRSEERRVGKECGSRCETAASEK